MANGTGLVLTEFRPLPLPPTPIKETHEERDPSCFQRPRRADRELNGVPTATEKFDVQPSVRQTMENRIQESSEYLQLVNVHPVTERVGEKLGIGIKGPSASRTNTCGCSC